MLVSGNSECPHIIIFISSNKLKLNNQFNYLGTLISSDGHSNSEVASRIMQAKKKSSLRMKSVLSGKYISIHTKTRTHPDLQMQGLDYFKTATKETGGNRNVVVPTKNATNLMDCKEIKRNSISTSSHSKVTHK